MAIQTKVFDESFQLENGSVLPKVHITYTTYGTINADKSNVIWVCHALTGDSNVFDWWQGLFGTNDYYNPDEYFIICANILGSHYGTLNPLSEKEDNNPYFLDFPKFTIRDIVNLHIKLAQHLQLNSIHTLIGGSMGGQQALEWSIMCPKMIKNLILIATNAIHSSWGVAFNESQRLCIENDISWGERHVNAGINGMKIARSIALLSYRTSTIYNKKQEVPIHAIKYQNYQGEKLAKRFNAYSYWYLTHAMDSHNITRNRKNIKEVCKNIQANTLIISILDDLLFPLVDQKILAENIPGSVLKIVNSEYGHDGFLIETNQISQIIQIFNENQNLGLAV